MTKNKEANVNNVMQDVEVAVGETMRTFENVAEDVVAVAEDLHLKKLRSLNRVAEAAKSASQEIGMKADAMSSDLTAKASEVTTNLVSKAADVAETVGLRASEIGAKAGEVTLKTGKRVQEQPWIVTIVALVLLLALGVSLGRRHVAEA